MTKHDLLTVSVGLMLCLSPLGAQSLSSNQWEAGQQVQAQQSQIWTGVLLDAGCKATTPDAKCEITGSTQVFGFQTSDGKYFKLDNDGSAKVRAALEAKGSKTGTVEASLSGKADGDVLKVESVEIH
jgi:hypothetical protein